MKSLELRPKPKRLSVEIDTLLAHMSEGSIRLREMIYIMQARAYTLLLVLISLPFCLPIPLPGLSTVFGIVIAIIGLRLSLRMEPWLPAKLLDKELSGKVMMRLLQASRRIACSLEALLRPRWTLLVDWVVLHHVYGAMICISGLFLLLPLPVPLSNFFPGVTVIFLAAALIERDGYFIVAGVIMFLLSVAFFAGLYIGGFTAVSFVREWFGGIYHPEYEQPPEGFPLPLPELTPQPEE